MDKAMLDSAPTILTDTRLYDGDTLTIKEWIPSVPTRGTIHLLHGMAEHSGRYHEFANFLKHRGWRVLAHDHRGHGNRISESRPAGHFSGVDGWNKVVSDVRSVVEAKVDSASRDPYFLFGHSMGSFIAQAFTQQYAAKVSGVILSGTGYQPAWYLQANEWVSKMERFRCGHRGVSGLLRKLTFDKFNQQFAPNRTPFDWLSRSDEAVDRYIEDPLCGFDCSTQTWVEFIHGMKKITRNYEKFTLPEDIAFMLLSGAADPIHADNQGVVKLGRALRRCGVRSVTTKLYPDARHEILHETNKDEVMEDMHEWLLNQARSSLDLTG